MLIQGEGEVAFKELVDTLIKKEPLNQVPNLWFKETDGSVVINGLVKYMDMQDLPNQDLEFWDSKHFLKPYDGVMYKSGFFEMSRGCMHKCHYCFNRYVQVGLKDAGKYRRNKTTEKIISEIKAIKGIEIKPNSSSQDPVQGTELPDRDVPQLTAGWLGNN